MNAPVAPTRPYVHHEHGVERPDPWHWLRDRDDPETIAYLEAENAYTEAMTAHTGVFRAHLFEEIKGRIQETDSSAPYRRGPFWYYTRTVAGLAYPIVCRRPDRPDAAEQILLDINLIAADHGYTDVSMSRVSPNHRFLAYAVDHEGRELFDVVVIDLETGVVIDASLMETSGDFVWAMDNRTLLYTELDDTLRPWRARLHEVGTDPADDPIVREERDPRFRLGVDRTRSDAFLEIAHVSGTTTEVWLVPADAPETAPRCVAQRHPGTRYEIDHLGDRLFVLTDDCDDADGNHTQGAVNFKLMVAPVTASSRADQVEWITHRPDVQLVSVDVFARHVVLFEREDGLLHLRVIALDGSSDRRIALPESPYDLHPDANPTQATNAFRFGFESLVTPPTTYSVDLDTGVLTVLKRTEVLGGYDPAAFATERITATAPDGAAVPISLVYPRGAARDGTTPFVLYGYGSYGITVEASFTHARLALLDRGVGFAIAHVRGGGLLGRPWYESGKMAYKVNTFTDFVACAEHLIATGWTAPDRLGIYGGSAGGLLMGAVINLRPALFRCAVAAVPFVDVVSTMLDESIPLTTNEWEEWGNPNEAEAFRRMLAYSPYDNVHDAPHFPDLLITSGLNDPRVQYWEPTKWCAKLRATITAPAEILLKTHMGAGHQGQSGRYGRLEDKAFEFTFLLDKLGRIG